MHGLGQFVHARHARGAPLPARRAARTCNARLSALSASPGPPGLVDPSAPHARAPSLMRQPLTACACSTPLQALTSWVRRRAAIATLRPADRRWAAFAALWQRRQQGAAAPRPAIDSRRAPAGVPGRVRHAGAEMRAHARHARGAPLPARLTARTCPPSERALTASARVPSVPTHAASRLTATDQCTPRRWRAE